MEERLQKILAKAGYGSRRSCEDLIEHLRVTVNGVSAHLGQKADPARDKIMVDGQSIPEISKQFVYYALNKPKGVLSDDDPRDTRPGVLSLVPPVGHLFVVGRLDLNSEGLVIITNDGDMAFHLTHPRFGHEKEYRVLVGTRPDQEQLNIWRRGVVMEDGYQTMPAQVELEGIAGSGAWLTIVMKEGKKRQIREIGKRIGVPVLRILRTRIESIHLGNLKPGEWRSLTDVEVKFLRAKIQASASPRPQKRPMNRRVHTGAGRVKDPRSVKSKR
jgi:23S rRNA pseudouridine2605 synthase